MSRRNLSGLICAIAAIASSSLAAAGETTSKRAECQTADGVSIVGDFYPAAGADRAPLAILLHMYRHDRTSWLPLIAPLHEAGFAVLAIDLRGHGESIEPASMKLAERVKQRDPGLFNAMHLDVEAATAWARKQPGVHPEKLVLVGASVGCSIALDVAARDQSVDAVVCLSPGTNYLGVDSTAHIRKTRNVPILLLAEERERTAVDELAALATNAKGEIVGPDDNHGTRMFGKIAGIERKIVDFLKSAVAK